MKEFKDFVRWDKADFKFHSEYNTKKQAHKAGIEVRGINKKYFRVIS